MGEEVVVGGVGSSHVDDNFWDGSRDRKVA